MQVCEGKMIFDDILEIKNGRNQKNVENPNGKYPIYGSGGIMGYADDYICEADTVIIGRKGSINNPIYVEEPFWNVDTAFGLSAKREILMPRYLYYFCQYFDFERLNKAVTIPSLTKSDLLKIELKLPTIETQKKIVDRLIKVEQIIQLKKRELQKLDTLVKSRFIELFGDLKTNSKGWQIVGFKDCADIDTNMVHDFEGYEDYPHIGIDSIEKETGRLIGYRTIAEDGIISGKYLFTPEHIIYSKIRPNLNKVAMPDFDGLCSADAYPILVKEGICNREYFGYTLRSQYFLDYILAFSNRTNLPKVNKSQVEGFVLPLPPIELQNQFADFVVSTDKSKSKIQKSLEETQLLFDSLMQKYFG